MPKRAVAFLALLLVAGCGAGHGSPAAPSKPASAAAGSGASGSGHPVATLIPPADPAVRAIRVPVLTYHRVVSPDAPGLPDLKVAPPTFLAELRALNAAGYHTIHQAQLFDALYKGAPLPSRPVLISVDDGYIDDVRTILPDLQRLGMVATFFVITGRMSEPGFLDAGAIRQLDQAGMDVGDHTAHHVDLRLLTPDQLRAETAGSRHALESVLGHPVYFFAYPFGAFDPQVVSAVKTAGYTMAFTTRGGSTETTQAPLTMPRIHVGAALTATGLLSLLGGG